MRRDLTFWPGLVVFAGLLLGYPCRVMGAAKGEYCQILDYVDEPIHRVEMMVVPSSGFEGFGSSGMLVLSADAELLYLRNIMHGTLEMDFHVEDLFFLGGAHLDLPDSLAEIALEVGWTGRYRDGLAFQWRAYPGYYWDMGGLDKGFYLPFSLAGIRSFTPKVSGIAGLAIRPGFGLWLMPIIGAEWEIMKELRLEAGVPRSRILWYLHREWSAHASLQWDNMSYALHDERERVTLNDYRLEVGASYRYSDQVEFYGDLGRAFNRSISFQDDDVGTIDIDASLYLKVGVGASF